jgi:hypothetical protein
MPTPRLTPLIQRFREFILREPIYVLTFNLK